MSGGRNAGEMIAAAIYGPERIVETPTLTAQAGEDAVRYRKRVPAPGTWINQQLLIARLGASLLHPHRDEGRQRLREGVADLGHGPARLPPRCRLLDRQNARFPVLSRRYWQVTVTLKSRPAGPARPAARRVPFSTFPDISAVKRWLIWVC